MEKFKTPSAIVVLLTRIADGKTQILMQKRKNTGFADGMWDWSFSGHVEYKESMTVAAVREAKEELGVAINAKDLQFATIIHKRDELYDVTYYNGYFVCDKFVGEPKICESEKCSEIKWFCIDSLPEDVIDDRVMALNAYLNKIPYIEYGWNSEKLNTHK